MISRCSRQHSRAFPLLGQSRPTRESRTFAWIKGMTTTRFGNWGRYLAILCIFERERKKHKPSNGKSAGSARRWVVERTHSWMNRFRGVLIRWEKKVENYLGLLHLACAWITYRAAGLLGEALILVVVCEGCCSCCTLLVCFARAMASHYEDEPQGSYPSKTRNAG